MFFVVCVFLLGGGGSWHKKSEYIIMTSFEKAHNVIFLFSCKQCLTLAKKKQKNNNNISVKMLSVFI